MEQEEGEMDACGFPRVTHVDLDLLKSMFAIYYIYFLKMTYFSEILLQYLL